MIKLLLKYVFLFSLTFTSLHAQETAVINGSFETNVNVFLRDSLINAITQPQYQNQFYGGEAWLNLTYAINGFTAGVRYDMYNNSNLPNPNGSFTDHGLRRWFVSKKFDNFDITVGNIYDQIGSGILYRSYEQRPLYIDNSLLGARIQYNFTDNISLKGIVGRQRDGFDFYGGNLKGLELNTFFLLGEENPITLAPGVGFMNKTISDAGMDKVVGSLKTYLDEDRFKPTFNNYAFSFFNTLGYKGFNWYFEGAYKTNDIYFNPMAQQATITGQEVFGKLEYKPGSVLYSSLSYAKGNIGITLEGKRTENFVLRMDPSDRLLRGLVSYIPPMTRVNTYRLTARYSPATQEISELAYQLDVKYRWSKKLSTLVNLAYINTLDDTPLYRELFTEVKYKHSRSLQVTGGVQYQDYNQEIYLVRPDKPNIVTITPYLDVLYKLDRKQSLRVEMQYMQTDRDLGSWLFALAEYSIAPKWIFEASAMYNTVPFSEFTSTDNLQNILYPTFGAVYITGSNRFSLRYVKQVEGIVCSGGICRLEPAFSGVRFSYTTNF